MKSIKGKKLQRTLAAALAAAMLLPIAIPAKKFMMR